METMSLKEFLRRVNVKYPKAKLRSVAGTYRIADKTGVVAFYIYRTRRGFVL